jgi:hypothetical protein
VQKGIVINVNLYATQDVHLKVATAKGETVNVTADAELINTTSAELGTTVNEFSVTELPLNGRDPSNLVLLAPGMISATAHGGEGIQGGFSFPTETAASANGGRQGSTYYMLDGVSNMDNYTAATSPMPNPDATQTTTARSTASLPAVSSVSPPSLEPTRFTAAFSSSCATRT